MLNGTTFSNSNGRKYEVIKHDTIRKVAILEPHNPTWKPQPFMVAKGFEPTENSWGSGTYDLTMEVAQEIFDDYR